MSFKQSIYWIKKLWIQQRKTSNRIKCDLLFRSVVFCSRPRSEGWPHHGRTFSIYLCPLSFWLTLSRRVLSTSWCCQSRPCVVFLACVHLALFLALSLSPRNSLVSSWCDHSMPALSPVMLLTFIFSIISILSLSLFLPSVLWRCWLGSRKGIQPVKNWVVGCWRGYLSRASLSEVQTCIRLSWCHCHSLSLASVKSRLVLSFWYRLTR